MKSQKCVCFFVHYKTLILQYFGILSQKSDIARDTRGLLEQNIDYITMVVPFHRSSQTTFSRICSRVFVKNSTSLPFEMIEIQVYHKFWGFLQKNKPLWKFTLNI